ncbi:hypothetical protein Vretimale_3303 [Volvox reticuliferus]|uniref:DnaJ-like protein n=1 Tax=Volvox reticuliferus TaxID=1737510 RepID=A0A8J4G073_9CHLO|nr:hypothetical protein Vretimale_3303 [Volvox reticuliferus]
MYNALVWRCGHPQVLSDDTKKAIYDKYGEAGLKGSMGGMGGGAGVEFTNPFDLFESFFGMGGMSGMGGMGGMGGFGRGASGRSRAQPGEDDRCVYAALIGNRYGLHRARLVHSLICALSSCITQTRVANSMTSIMVALPGSVGCLGISLMGCPGCDLVCLERLYAVLADQEGSDHGA